MTNQGGVPADWYDDPEGSGRQRWWDGTNWTDHFAPVPDASQSAAVADQPSSQTAEPETAEPVIAEPVTAALESTESETAEPVIAEPVTTETSSSSESKYKSGGPRPEYLAKKANENVFAGYGEAVPARGIYDNCLWVLQENYANFGGRARRSEFWLFQIVTLLLAAWLLGVILILTSISENMGPVVFLLIFAVNALMLVPNLALIVRRLHDIDRSGWMCCLVLVPYVGGIILLVFLAIDGTHGPNKYGPSPKYR